MREKKAARARQDERDARLFDQVTASALSEWRMIAQRMIELRINMMGRDERLHMRHSGDQPTRFKSSDALHVWSRNRWSVWSEHDVIPT